MKKSDKSIKLFNLDIFSSNKEELLRGLTQHISDSIKTAYIFTPNPEQIVIAYQEPKFRQVLESADVLIPDGAGLRLASFLISLVSKTQVIPHKIPGREVAQDLLKLATDKKYRVAVIGGREYDQLVNQGVAWHPGYTQVAQPQPQEEQEVVSFLTQTKPDILLVAFGAPAQEYWVDAHRHLLEKLNIKLVMVVGGSFDVILGKLKRPPDLVTQLGCEWFYRLLQEPWRWRRQLRLITFGWLTLREMMKGW